MALFDRFKKPNDPVIPPQQPSIPQKQAGPAEKPQAPKQEEKPKAKKEKKAKAAKKSKKEVSTKKTPVSPRAAKLGMLISKPLITEKATILAEKGTYVFFVDTSANKIQIKQAVHAVYGVMPVSVRISNHKGKAVRWGRLTGKRADRKKAYVTLKKGDSIDYAV